MSFTSTELDCLKRIEVLRDMLTEQDVLGEPCPLLASQLNELIVISEKLTRHAQSLLRATQYHLSLRDQAP